MKRWMTALTVVSATTLAVVGTATQASAVSTSSTPTVEISAVGTARLVDGGAAIDVPLTVTCSVGTVYAFESTTEAFVDQSRLHGRWAGHVWGENYGEAPLCDGSAHVRVVRVLPEFDGVWRVGFASVDAEADVHYQEQPGVWQLAYVQVTQRVKVRR